MPTKVPLPIVWGRWQSQINSMVAGLPASISCVSAPVGGLSQCRIMCIREARQSRSEMLAALATKKHGGGHLFRRFRGRRASHQYSRPPGFYLVTPDTRYRRRASISAAVLLVLSKGRNISKPSPSG
jgi:hypothetical protein